MTRPSRLIRAYPRPSAGGLEYDNSGSGLDATNVQDAIDELAVESGAISVTDGTTTVDPTSEVAFDPTYFDVTDGDYGVAEVTLIAAPPSVPPPILLASDHSVPFTFDEILQNSEGTDFLWASE